MADVHAAEPPQPAWAGLIPDAEWALYREVIAVAQAANVRFALGGGFAFSHYARRWRNTKDIDLYILPEDRERMIALVSGIGGTDLQDRQPYDPTWIYRAGIGDVIVDLIWASANHYRPTDAHWFARAPLVTLRDKCVHIVPVEELVYAKLYVVQRERCDWPDLMNVLYLQAAKLDWKHLLWRCGDDAGLLGGLLRVFAWICTEQARAVPAWVWERVGVVPPAEAGPPCRSSQEGRVRLLDSRDWFGPSLASPPDPVGTAA